MVEYSYGPWLQKGMEELLPTALRPYEDEQGSFTRCGCMWGRNAIEMPWKLNQTGPNSSNCESNSARGEETCLLSLRAFNPVYSKITCSPFNVQNV
jgi:hypothetical protein